jgi:hypothetical protein
VIAVGAVANPLLIEPEWGPKVAEQRRQRREMNVVARAQVNRALRRGPWGKR